MKWYGNLNNRIMEQGKDAEEITVGMGVTEFSWSDRHAYEVTKVIDQKHISIRELKHTPADNIPMSNNWKLESDPTRPEIDLVKRGKYWYTFATITQAEVEKIDAEEDANKRIEWQLWMCHCGFDRDVIKKNGKQTKYSKRNIRVGYADYYYDYEF